MSKYYNPDTWYVLTDTSLEEFIIGMIGLGYPIDTSLVGVFDEKGRGSRRDIDLPLHRDGEYSTELAKSQGGVYIEKEGIDIVGLYCLRDDVTKCTTIVDNSEVELRKGQALIFDNKKVLHGRKGEVGKRLVLRMWIKRV